MKKTIILLFVLLLSAGLLWAGGKQEEPEAEEPEMEEETAEEETAKEDKYGGTMTRAYFAPSTLDPAFTNDITGGEICGIWGDYLAYVDEDLSVDQSRSLAKNWEVSEDGLTWTFTLREGVMFHNGEEMTSEDVKFTFDRLSDPDIGAATANLYSNIASISAPGKYTVVFELKQQNPDFLSQLGEYQAIITWSGTEDFNTEHIGTGKFMIDTYLPEDRITFKRNPNYWRTDSEGNQLPYLDGIEYLFLPEPSSQVEALRGGQVDYLIYVPTEYVSSLEAEPDIEVYEKASNFHYAIRMRSDREPFNDVRVRQAFRAAVDRKEILEGSFEGLGVTGRDTPIGPAYGDYYLDVPEPKRDIAKAKSLLEEAGYGDGLTVTLTTQQSSAIPAIATILKEQLADAGVTIDIQLVPPDVYYGADNLWLEADFAMTDWGSRAAPQSYLNLAYTCDAQWNESHYCDEELDKLAEQAAVELDTEKRAELYAEIQRIFMDRGPLIVPYFTSNLFAATKKLKGIKPTSFFPTHVDYAVVYFEE
jgi:peptide/nickel transport system substrate-binding protein